MLHIRETVKALMDHGVTPTDGIDSSTAAGRMMKGSPEAVSGPDSSCHGRNLLHISLREGAGRWVRGSV